MSASFEKAAKKEVSYADLLDELLATEVSSMAQKHHQMRIAMARFPLQKTLEGFDFKSQTSIDSKLVRELATGRYMRSGDTCYSSGRPEWGKAICDLGCARPGGSAFASAGRAETKANQADSSRSRCARHDLFVIDDALDGDPICSRVSSSSAPFPCHRLLLSFARASPCLPTSRYYHRSCIEYLRFGPQPSRPLWSTHRQAATSLSSPSRNSGTEPYRLLIKHLKVWLGDGPPVPSQVPPPQSSQFGHQAEGSFQVGTLHPARSPTLYSRVKVEGYVHAYQDCASESPNVFRHPSFLYQRTQANPDYIRLARFPLLDQGRVVTSVEDSILKGVGMKLGCTRARNHQSWISHQKRLFKPPHYTRSSSLEKMSKAGLIGRSLTLSIRSRPQTLLRHASFV